MAKYITADLYKKYSAIIPIEFERKITVFELWNLVADHFIDDAEMVVGLKEAVFKFTIKDKEYKIVKSRSDVLVEVNNDIKEEKYDLFITDALHYILDNKLIKKQRKKKV